jgi:hypothetical protein
MDSYGYLSVLVSIVLGLGITNILYGLAGLVRERDRVRMYWPVPIWMVTLFLAHVQMWWAMFALREVTDWTFASFLAVLLQPVSLFLTSALIVPNLSGDRPVDLKEDFFRERRWFGSGLIAIVVTSLSKNLIVNGGVDPADMVAHGVFVVLALSAIFIKNDRVHRIAAPGALILLLAYIGLLFTNLGGNP